MYIYRVAQKSKLLTQYNSLLFFWATLYIMSTAGWHTCLKSVVIVFHSVVNGFLR